MASLLREERSKISKVKQACDYCHDRKIRCDGMSPCMNCDAAELQCTYCTVLRKKGPKGPRTKKPMGTSRRRSEHVEFASVNIASNALSPSISSENEQRQLPRPVELRGCTAFGFEPSPLLSPDIFRRCVDGFFEHKYPIMPILDRELIYASLPHIYSNLEQYGLITALCAFIILQPETLGPPILSEQASDPLPSPELFISETQRSRQYCNHIASPTLAIVQTSFFLFGAHFALDKDDSAWYYLREAITLLQLQRFHEESTYTSIPNLQYAAYYRRTFWLLFVTERAYALQRHRPLTLQRTINLPVVSGGPESTIISGFLDLVSLFQNFDDKFISLWNPSSVDAQVSPLSFIYLQDVLKSALPDVSDRTEIQQADLLITRQWLKTMVWQLCVTKGLLSSSPTSETMSFYYPITIARDVVLISRLLPPKSFEAHGVGILEKVFDIGCSLTDVLLLHPNSSQSLTLEIGPRDYLMELVRILGTVLGGNSKYLTLLAAKADECLQVRVRGSLWDSTSNDIRLIDKSSDDDRIFEEENDDASPYSPETPYF